MSFTPHHCGGMSLCEHVECGVCGSCAPACRHRYDHLCMNCLEFMLDIRQRSSDECEKLPGLEMFGHNLTVVGECAEAHQ